MRLLAAAALACLLLTGCKVKGTYEEHRKQIDGVDCVVVRSNKGVAVDCDWSQE